jgi:predicted kinase
MLVGFTGHSGSRKTVAAKHLEKTYGFDRIHAGDPIKKGLEKGFGLSRGQIRSKGKDTPAMELGGAEPRDALEAQGYGTAVAAPHATASHLHRRLARRLSKGKHVAVDGVRQEAEAQVIRRLGGQIWRMDNGKEPDPKLPMDKMQSSIIADRTIDSSAKNKGGKDDKGKIRDQIDKAMAEHLAEYHHA